MTLQNCSTANTCDFITSLTIFSVFLKATTPRVMGLHATMSFLKKILSLMVQKKNLKTKTFKRLKNQKADKKNPTIIFKILMIFHPVL